MFPHPGLVINSSVLLQIHSRHADVAIVAQSTVRAHAVVDPSDLSPTRSGRRPSDDTRAPRRIPCQVRDREPPLWAGVPSR